MASAITGTPYLSAAPTAYSGANSQLSPAIQTIWSKEILFQAMPILRFEQFAVKKTELGVQPGLTVNFMRYNNLGQASQLVEGVRMQTNALTASQFSITGLTGSHWLTSHTIKDAVETLATKNVPRLGETYVAFVDPHQARRLRDDPEWIETTKYAAPGNFMLGEIGRINDVVFIETTQVLSTETHNGQPGGAPVHQAIVIGDNAFGHAISLPVELRDGGIMDFGREHALAWYAIWGLGLITDNSVVIIETN
jgi:hypothetical protein